MAVCCLIPWPPGRCLIGNRFPADTGSEGAPIVARSCRYGPAGTAPFFSPAKRRSSQGAERVAAGISAPRRPRTLHEQREAIVAVVLVGYFGAWLILAAALELNHRLSIIERILQAPSG